jgi:phytoene desaturase
MRAIVIGAGLGGLGVGLRLQSAGFDVTVLEQGDAPGGRAARIREAGYTWDTGPSLITMPWVLEDTFAAGGLDLRREVTLRRLDPMYRIRWAGDERAFDFVDSIEGLRESVAAFSPADARRVGAFLAALRPIYEHGILGAGQRPFGDARTFLRLVPTMARLRAIEPLHSFVARYFTHPRVREAFSFHSLFIGGDPFRVPAIYGALVYLQVLDGGWYTDGGVYSVVEAMARPLEVRTGARVEQIETAGRKVTGVRLSGGERVPAEVVVSNADVLQTAELLGRRRPWRRLRPTMSCFLLYLGTDRRYPALLHHTLLVGRGYRDFIRSVTRDGRLAETFSTYVHAPARTESAMAAPGGDSLAVLLPVPNLRGGLNWTREADRLRDALVTDLETTFGLDGLGDSIRVEHRMTPVDFRDRLGAVDGNAFSLEPTLQQSAYFRAHNRVDGVAGMYHVGGGTHPGAGIPGVLLGAAVTAQLVQADARARGGRGLQRGRGGHGGRDGGDGRVGVARELAA